MSGEFKFVDLDPKEIRHIQRSRSGRLSYPILKAFLESGKWAVEFDPTPTGKTVNSLGSSLSSYAKSHDLPIKAFQRDGKLYLLRLDIDDEGNPIPDWQDDIDDVESGSGDDLHELL